MVFSKKPWLSLVSEHTWHFLWGRCWKWPSLWWIQRPQAMWTETFLFSKSHSFSGLKGAFRHIPGIQPVLIVFRVILLKANNPFTGFRCCQQCRWWQQLLLPSCFPKSVILTTHSAPSCNIVPCQWGGGNCPPPPNMQTSRGKNKWHLNHLVPNTCAWEQTWTEQNGLHLLWFLHITKMNAQP